MSFKNIDEPNAHFKNLPRSNPSEPPSDSSIACLPILSNKIVLYMYVENIQDPRPYYENSPDFSPDRSPTIWASALFEISLSATGLPLCAFHVLQEYWRPKPLFSKFLQIPPWGLPSGWSIFYLCDIFEYNCAIFMCFKNIRDPNPYSENFTWTPPLRATLWFKHRLFYKYYRMPMCYIYDILECNIQEFNRYLTNFPDLIIEGYAPSESCMACLCDILKAIAQHLYFLSDSDTKNGGFLDLSDSKETRECKAI